MNRRKFMKNLRKVMVFASSITPLCSCSSNTITESSKEVYVQPESSVTSAISAFETVTEPIETETSTEVFTGFKTSDKELVLGNSLSCLNQNGLIYSDGNMRIYNDNKGNLILQQDTEKNIIAELVNAKCINVIGERIYYINSNDESRVYSYDMKTSESQVFIDCPVSFLLMTNDLAVYENDKHRLYLCENENISLISEQTVLWIDVFGNNLIFTELEEKNSQIKSVNLETQDITELIEYGFSPAIYDEYIYYQDKAGEISRMNLYNGESEKYLSEWGQQFCSLNNNFYYLSSKGIIGNEGILYNTENENYSLTSLFICDNELYYTESNGIDINLYKFEPEKNETELIE